ncbi:glycine cleavage system aminomethyltransferase GcvT [Clostridium sp. YIM B02515]|uniref:Aminomethyltransferase n=1 Tax=Clostridium rhizosphaerae TaxID=2803861 RepID=A0ABS1TE04_9CLOT|nr:glycine cleavage system aminomethyltransferase GcvT [Clostridium rhizosphaerae]MBL4937565.1 glycine cleavage system aminomethyltransferase GcvT [Clostridium rhizosphaerae]
MDNLKKTRLYDAHIKYGGKLIEFARWMLPVQYEGIIEEHEAVRNAAGLFDVSHMGEIKATGKDAFNFVQNLVTNDISVLEDNQVIYTFMCYENGGVVDDLLVYKFNKEDYLLVINASNVEKDFQWMLENKMNYEVELKNISEEISEVALQGPKAQEILQTLTAFNLDDIKFFYCRRDVVIDGIKCLVSRTGYTGEDGFEIYTNNEDITKIWNSILEAGKTYGVKPAGLGCRDTLRFEAALPLYGNEISKDITPLEAGLGFFVKLNKKSFIGKEALVRQKEEGLKRKLVGFEMNERGIPRHGYEVTSNGENIGFVTTGYMSPTLKKNIGLALIDSKYTELGTEIDILIRNKSVKAKVISKKFYSKNYKK